MNHRINERTLPRGLRRYDFLARGAPAARRLFSPARRKLHTTDLLHLRSPLIWAVCLVAGSLLVPAESARGLVARGNAAYRAGRAVENLEIACRFRRSLREEITKQEQESKPRPKELSPPPPSQTNQTASRAQSSTPSQKPSPSQPASPDQSSSPGQSPMPGQMQTWSTRNSPGATGGGFGMQWSQHFQFGNTGTLNPFRPGIGQLGMPPALGTSPVNASQVHGKPPFAFAYTLGP